MSKDPAFLFYSSDFLTGTMFMSNEEVGMYIKLLCAQHQKGRLTKDYMLQICGAENLEIFSKFLVDKEGLYYNKRLEEECIKRRKYSESRSKNRKGKKTHKKHMLNTSKTYVPHMENENENKDINDNKGVNWKAQILLPWDSDKFCKVWEEWLEYKRIQHKFKFKSPKYEQIALNKLFKDSGENEAAAITAIADSIANGWKGIIFKNQVNGKQTRAEKWAEAIANRSYNK